MPVPLTDLQGINPTSIIELFELELDKDLHGNQALGWQAWIGGSTIPISAERKATAAQARARRPTI